MNPRSYYSPDDDLVLIHVRESKELRSDHHEWGLIDRDVDSGAVASIELWHASKVLPPEVLDALPTVGRSDTSITQEDLAKRQPA